VIFGGSLLGIFAGFYFWWPKVFGHLLSEKLGKWNFWLMLIGFNMTFGPMHILGLQGMSRRIDSYSPGFGFEFWNMFASIGSFIIALGVLMFGINVITSARRARHEPPVGPDPWDARSLEWFTPNPTPVHNFDELIQVDALDEFWHRKYAEDENGRVVRVATAEEVCQDGSATDVHLPSPSYWPFVLAAGFPFVGFGLIYTLWICIPGALLILMAIYGWIFEPTDDPDGPHGHHAEDSSDHDGAEAPSEVAGETAEEAPVG
jgi:cytochrome c oxidase subunit 1